ncbi:MAG: GHMP kinase [Bacteroidetes bacterium]|nr:GHMP kinase [Bacteroidota bacterium]
MSNEFYSRGKLLLTGEYFVMEGSQALAVPLNVGQRLFVEKCYSTNLEINWKSYAKNKLWFEATFDLKSLNIVATNDLHIANYLQKLLSYVKNKSVVMEGNQAIQIKTYLDFLPEWGFGSSSSLISNLAYWANISPYDLFFSVSEGSGYDIACARSDTPILYQWKQEPIIHSVKFEPNFLDYIYFVYLGKKQDSLKSVQENKANIKGKKSEMNRITELTKSITEINTLDEFDEIIKEHEEIVSKSIKEEKVKSKYFSDFQGVIKSLGAWGGDFILVTHKGDPDYIKNYFNKKGLDVIFPYKELVL